MTTRAVLIPLVLSSWLYRSPAEAQDGQGVLVYSADLGLAFLESESRAPVNKLGDPALAKATAIDNFAAELFQDRRGNIEASKDELGPTEYQKTSVKLELHKRIVAKEMAEARPQVLDSMKRRLAELRKHLAREASERFTIIETPRWLLPPRSKKCDLTDRLSQATQGEAPTIPECRYQLAMTVDLPKLVGAVPTAMDPEAREPEAPNPEAQDPSVPQVGEPLSPLSQLLREVATANPKILFLAGPTEELPSCDVTEWAAGALGAGSPSDLRRVCPMLAPPTLPAPKTIMGSR